MAHSQIGIQSVRLTRNLFKFKFLVFFKNISVFKRNKILNANDSFFFLFFFLPFYYYLFPYSMYTVDNGGIQHIVTSAGLKWSNE